MTGLRSLSGHLVVQHCHLNSVFELYPFNHLAQLPEPPQPSPPFLGTLSELEHHAQHSIAAQTPFGSPGAMSNRRKRRFNRIGGPNALPVLGWKIIKRQQLLSVLLQDLNRLGILVLIHLDKLIKRLVRLLTGFRHPDLTMGFDNALSTSVVLFTQ